MSAFIKNNFEYHGGYLHYITDTGDRKFVARFKHRGPVTKSKFQSILINNYSVEEYFNRLDCGEAPLQILQNDDILVFHHDIDGGCNYFTLDEKSI